jgi:hypothetical protein
MLEFVPANDVLARLVDVVRAESLLSSRKYTEALHLAEQTLKYKKIGTEDRHGLEAGKIIAESRLGMKKQALTDWEAWESEETPANSVNEARRQLVAAEVYLANGLAQQAHDNGAKAVEQFASTGQFDSELHSSCIVALAAKALNDSAEYDISSRKAVDIASKIQQTWSPQVSVTYFSRPDLQMLMRAVPVAARPE